jgi:ketosteroid isomerase-like protein
MSQKNVEAFKRVIDANNRGDYDAVLEECDPDIEWHAIFGMMFGGEATVVRGHEAVLEHFRELDEGFAVRDVQWSEFRDIGERVVALGHVRAEGRESGVALDSPWAGVADFRGGKICGFRDYLDHIEALEAAGLSE